MPVSAPSRYVLPQHASRDLAVARRAHLAWQRRKYVFMDDEGPGHPADGFRLPRRLAALPDEERFSLQKRVRLATHKGISTLNARVAPLLGVPFPYTHTGDVERLYRFVAWPVATHRRWHLDEEFARQRLAGVNPRVLRRALDVDDPRLAEAADRALEAWAQVARQRRRTAPGQAPEAAPTVHGLLDEGRLFEVDYRDLAAPILQDAVRTKRPGVDLSSGRCLFGALEGALVPLAIRLRSLTMPGAEHDPVFTPQDGSDWLMARLHLQCADAHIHQSVEHLLTTHLVNEAAYVAMRRTLHVDHPISQLLAEHYFHNLAIDDLARHNLLSIGGPIDTVFATGVGGVLDAARAFYGSWSLLDDTLDKDLAARGVDDEDTLPEYPYRDDSRLVKAPIVAYVDAIVRAWYPSGASLKDDHELQAFARELGAPDGAGLVGLPEHFHDRGTLRKVLVELLYRASVQHAAVNNGQFDAYGWIPNACGTVRWALPKGEGRAGPWTSGPSDVFRALPPASEATVAMGMAWTLSEPTWSSITALGQAPAMAGDVNPKAREAVAEARRALSAVSDTIARRNRERVVPYTYVDPLNVDVSTST